MIMKLTRNDNEVDSGPLSIVDPPTHDDFVMDSKVAIERK